MHDFEPGWDTYVERPGYGLQADLSFDQVKVDGFDAVLILGGRAPECLRNNQRLLRLVREFDANGKWIFAICHGIQVLAAAGLTKGKCFTCYEHVRFEVEQAGGTFVANEVVRDGRLVTGQTWQSHPEFYREVFACLAQQAEPTTPKFSIGKNSFEPSGYRISWQMLSFRQAVQLEFDWRALSHNTAHEKRSPQSYYSQSVSDIFLLRTNIQ
jgi:protease I